MSVEERDHYTGYLTTGHSWNGIKELNSRVPRVWYITFIIFLVFSILYWIYMPAWPSVRSYTQGILKFDQRTEVTNQVTRAEHDKNILYLALFEQPLSELVDNETKMTVIKRVGSALFEDNCAGCHGIEGDGARFFPNLNDNAWLWSNDPESIYQTIRFGINSNHPKTRVAIMPGFGSSNTLNSSQIEDVLLYVQSLTNERIADGTRAAETVKANNGRHIFLTHCVACHGADGAGNQILGAPSLIDSSWIYGSSSQDIKQSITNGRAGLMPGWVNRLDDSEIKLLSLYVLTLSNNMDHDSQNFD